MFRHDEEKRRTHDDYNDEIRKFAKVVESGALTKKELKILHKCKRTNGGHLCLP
jgi:hypothetical protein